MGGPPGPAGRAQLRPARWGCWPVGAGRGGRSDRARGAARHRRLPDPAAAEPDGAAGGPERGVPHPLGRVPAGRRGPGTPRGLRPRADAGTGPPGVHQGRGQRRGPGPPRHRAGAGGEEGRHRVLRGAGVHRTNGAPGGRRWAGHAQGMAAPPGAHLQRRGAGLRPATAEGGCPDRPARHGQVVDRQGDRGPLGGPAAATGHRCHLLLLHGRVRTSGPTCPAAGRGHRPLRGLDRRDGEGAGPRRQRHGHLHPRHGHAADLDGGEDLAVLRRGDRKRRQRPATRAAAPRPAVSCPCRWRSANASGRCARGWPRDGHNPRQDTVPGDRRAAG